MPLSAIPTVAKMSCVSSRAPATASHLIWSRSILSPRRQRTNADASARHTNQQEAECHEDKRLQRQGILDLVKEQQLASRRAILHELNGVGQRQYYHQPGTRRRHARSESGKFTSGFLRERQEQAFVKDPDNAGRRSFVCNDEGQAASVRASRWRAPAMSVSLDHPEPVAIRVAEKEHRRHEISQCA